MIDDYNDADFAMTSQVGFGLGATLPEGSVGSLGISSCGQKRRCYSEGGVTLRTKPKMSKWVAWGLDR